MPIAPLILIAAAPLVAWRVPKRFGDVSETALSTNRMQTGTPPSGGDRFGFAAPSAQIGGAAAMVLKVPDPAHACESVRRRMDKTFAPDEAPALPLKDCGHVDCRCRYERIANRRKGERRVSPDRRDSFRFEMKDDRRKGRDRRRGQGVVWKGSGV